MQVNNQARGGIPPAPTQERSQVEKRMTRYDYTKGPMYYIGQQIVKRMEDAGYPSKIFICYRSPEQQQKEFDEGDSNARAFESAHQYSLAVDIIHLWLGWQVSEDYWETLAAVVKVVSEEFQIPLVHGHYWNFVDSAHIEFRDWREYRDEVGHFIEPPDERELFEWFEEILPRTYKTFLKTARGGRMLQRLGATQSMLEVSQSMNAKFP